MAVNQGMSKPAATVIQIDPGLMGIFYEWEQNGEELLGYAKGFGHPGGDEQSVYYVLRNIPGKITSMPLPHVVGHKDHGGNTYTSGHYRFALLDDPNSGKTVSEFLQWAESELRNDFEEDIMTWRLIEKYAQLP